MLQDTEKAEKISGLLWAAEISPGLHISIYDSGRKQGNISLESDESEKICSLLEGPQGGHVVRDMPV